MRIFLIGFMGSGKTTVGKKMANKLGYDFIDMDDYIVSKYNKTINDIFAEEGEEQFRRYEQETLHELCAKENLVISTGGGAPCFFDNVEVMNNHGKTVYLKLRTGFLVHRLMNAKDERPLIKGKTKEELTTFIDEMLEKRDAFYSKANMVVSNEGTDIKEIIKKILGND